MARAIPIGLLALLLTTFIAGLASTAPTRAAFPGENGKIAFTSDRDGDREIFVMNADGTNQTQLTSNLFRDIHPVWSPNGRKIAFMSTRHGDEEIWVMDADGAHQTQLTFN